MEERVDFFFIEYAERDSVTDKFLSEIFRDPASLVNIAPAFESLTKMKQFIFSLTQKKTHKGSFYLRERRDSNPRPLP